MQQQTIYVSSSGQPPPQYVAAQPGQPQLQAQYIIVQHQSGPQIIVVQQQHQPQYVAVQSGQPMCAQYNIPPQGPPPAQLGYGPPPAQPVNESPPEVSESRPLASPAPVPAPAKKKKKDSSSDELKSKVDPCCIIACLAGISLRLCKMCCKGKAKGHQDNNE